MTMRQKLEHFAHRTWQKKGLVSGALLPLSWLANMAIARKQRRFSTATNQARSQLPVVVVGNIYVGGTGKTPVVIALVQALQAKGWVPGVISRGYGRTKGSAPVAGQGKLDPTLFGDEPALIAAATNAPVCVHQARALALRHLEQTHPEVNIVITDDGLQHLALARDIEIVVQDARGVGNGRVLPAGPLREPASKLALVDYIVTNLQPDQPQPPLLDVSAHQVTMQLQPVQMQQLASGTTQTWDAWLGQNGKIAVGALAGIGQPNRFFGMLRACGMPLAKTLPLRDHAPIDASVFDLFGDYPILITAKDAVKCAEIDDPRLWVVHAAPLFSDIHWFDDVDQRLHAIANSKSTATSMGPVASNQPF